MRCPSCGAEGQNSKFCSYCGVQLLNNEKTVEEVKEGNLWPVAIFNCDDCYFAYDVYSDQVSAEYRSKSKCKHEIVELIEEYLEEEGIDEFPTREEIEQSKTFKKYMKKYDYTIENVSIRDLDDIFATSDNDEDGDYPFLDIKINDLGGIGTRRNKKSVRSYQDQPHDVYAVIEKSGLFYNGEIPNMTTFSKASLCRSREACIEKLKQAYRNNQGRIFDETAKQNLAKIREEYPDAEIIKIN